MSVATKAYSGFSVGPVRVDVPLVLAPMEDVTNLAFRLVAKRIGRPGLVFTEFVSANACHYNPDRARKKMRAEDEERPLAIQIFGSDPATMAESARMAEEMGADLVDINMGCWVPKVCRQGAGAALLKDPQTAEAVVRAVVEAVNVPVTVKVRAGWESSHFAAPDLARRFQDAGAQMLTLHARFAKQGFEGEADWRLLADLREAVKIPLIGNGDVKTPDDARRMIDETGCDGVMVGRAAISNPWALARIRAGLTGEEIPPLPTPAERLHIALLHANLMVQFEAEASDRPQDDPQVQLRAVRALRGQLPLYVKGIPGSAKAREKLSTVASVEEIRQIFSSLTDINVRYPEGSTGRDVTPS